MRQPILVPILGKESGDRWMLTGHWDGNRNISGDWIYQFELKGVLYRLVVPFLFDKLDGASVPRLMESVLRMGGREMPDEAWLPHDYMYFYKGKIPHGGLVRYDNGLWVDVHSVNRKFADQVFRNELEKPIHALSSFKPILAYLGVRAAFWKRW